jgi:hypothetical protein
MHYFNLLIALGLTLSNAEAFNVAVPKKQSVVFKSGISRESYSSEWKLAVQSRMPTYRLDSLANIKRALTVEEKAWQDLIASKGRSLEPNA